MNTKRVFALLLTLVMMLALAACGGEPDNNADVQQPVQDATEEATEQKATEPEEETEAQPTGLQYVVTVTDEGGNPIANAMVQMCEGTNCVPGKSDAEGKVTFTVQAEADFEVKFMALPAGYDYTTEEQVFHFEAGSKEMTIVLKAVA